MSDSRYTGFIRSNTELAAARLVPEIKLHLATDITPLWQASEDFLEINNISPPYWAFAWPGSEALARHITRHPGLVAGKRVLDFAAGCGLAALAAARAGAVVQANDIDPLAIAAIGLNADANGLGLETIPGDIVGEPCRWDVILCGDVCYEAPMTAHILPWLVGCAAAATVIIADPKRKYAPAAGCTPIASYEVPTSLALEDTASRTVTLLRLLPAENQGQTPPSMEPRHAPGSVDPAPGAD